MNCPHADLFNCKIASKLAGLPVIANRTDAACNHCLRCDPAQGENSVTASLAVSSLRSHRAADLAVSLAHLLTPDKHPAPLVQLSSPQATGEKRLHIGFQHGMGDYIHLAYLLQLYRRRGWDVAVCASQDRTSWLWEACGIRRECPAPVSCGWGYPNANAFWDNSSPESVGGHKVIDHVGVPPFPPIEEPKEALWRELCGVRLDLRPKLSQAARDEATRFLDGLPHPIVAYHGTGNAMRDGKSIPADVTLGVMRDLVQQDVSVVLLDWSSQDPIVSHPRARGVKAAWGDIDLERMLALYSQVDLVVGIDSGPFHAASLVGAKRLGVFPPDHVILPWRCVIPSPGDLHLIKRTLHWKPDHAQHKPGDLVPHAERRASTYPCVFYDPPLTAAPIVDAILQQLHAVDDSLAGRYIYERVGYDKREMELRPGGQVGDGSAALERRWSTPKPGEIAIHGASGKICQLRRNGDGWEGQWLAHERMPIRLVPTAAAVEVSLDATACCHRGPLVGKITCATLGKPDVFACDAWDVGGCVLQPSPAVNDQPVWNENRRWGAGTYSPWTEDSREVFHESIKRLPACSMCERHKQQTEHAKVFGEIYASDKWSNGSGPGSNTEACAPYRALIEDCISKRGVKSILDVGCGDGQSLTGLRLGTATYTGIDVAPVALERARKATPNGTFLELDATTVPVDKWPDADLVLIKDVIQHWPLSLVKDRMEAIVARYPRVLVTNSVECSFATVNAECKTGEFRPIDLGKPPFCLPIEPLLSFADKRVDLLRKLSSIGVCCLATDEIADVRTVTRPNLEAYCQRHGYPLHYHTDAGTYRPASWGKILIAQRHLAGHDWLWIIDADAVVTGPERRLEEITDGATGDLLLCEDHNGINTGSFLIRYCDWSVDFLRRVWETTEPHDHPWWEQWAVMRLLENPDDMRHVHVVPKRRLNSYPNDWQPGDFCLHTPGVADRVRVLSDYISRSRPSV